MKARLSGLAHGESLRLWVLFDSDALEPNRPSKEANEKRELCEASRVPYHQLQRREIENYLPRQVLRTWAERSPGNVRAARRRKALAFAGLLPEQRYHFNMKDGFVGDRGVPGGIPALFSDCAAHRDLQSGFGRDIASLFQKKDVPIHEEWLRRDGQHPETLGMVQSILQRL